MTIIHMMFLSSALCNENLIIWHIQKFHYTCTFFYLAYPFQNLKNDMIAVENLHPEKKDLFSRKQSQTQKPRAIKKENHDGK